MWIMNDLWPIETLCIIIIVDYAKSKINEVLAMYVPKQTILGYTFFIIITFPVIMKL